MTDETISFDQLAGLIGPASKPAISLANKMLVTQGLAGFIEPSFIIGDDGPSSKAASFLLIAAPAAVGKSVLAGELSFRTSNPLLDLAGRRIGEAFFTGWLSRQLGGLAALKLVAEVQEGRATLIVDAADEALVGNGPQDYAAAIQDLVDLIGAKDSKRPAVVILGRPDTIDETERVLTQAAASVSRIDVAFFGEDQARRFVRLKAFSANGSGPEKELQEFLSAFFEIVLDALGVQTWEEADSFVGYAPVLDALAKFYDPKLNMMRVLENIKRSNTTEHVWGLLINIIREVLNRETDKFATSFGGGNTAKEDYGRLCYSSDLQLSLLLADLPLEMSITPDIEPADVAWWVELETQVRDQFRVHPFIGSGLESEQNPVLRFTNAAFRDYAVAAMLGESDDLRARVIRDYWCAPNVAPSPILMRLAFSKEMGLEVVNSTSLTLLIASHAAEFRDDVVLLVEEASEPSDLNGVAVEVRLRERDQDVHSLSSYLAADEALYLLQGIAHAELNLPNVRIVAGEGAQEFSLGPLADITCAEFSSESPELRLRTGRDNEPSFIETNRISGVTRRVTPNSPSLLKLITPETAYPWSVFRAARPVDGGVTAEQWAAASQFQGNGRWYIKKSMVKGAPNYPADVMDNIIAKKRASGAVHRFALERDLISREDGVYFLNLNGFSVRNMVDADLSNPNYVAVLDDFVAWAQKHGLDL